MFVFMLALTVFMPRKTFIFLKPYRCDLNFYFQKIKLYLNMFFNIISIFVFKYLDLIIFGKSYHNILQPEVRFKVQVSLLFVTYTIIQGIISSEM